MTAEQGLSFDLDEGMLRQLRTDFGPAALRAELDRALKEPGPADAPTRASDLFAAFGEHWMRAALELGEKHSDHTYEVMKRAQEQTGSIAFPYFPQRFIEIAYLGTQSFQALPVVENSARALTFRVPSCDFYDAIVEGRGEEFARKLHCRQACLTACQTAFGHFGFQVTVEMQAALPGDGFCQFNVRQG